MNRTTLFKMSAVCILLAMWVPRGARAQQYAFQYLGIEQGLTNLAVKTLFQDRTGFIWVGTENGVFRYEGVRFREFAPEQGLPPSVEASIGEAPDGSVLVGSQSGLYRLTGEKFARIALPAGSRVNGYNGIRADGTRTWIATDAGLLAASIGENGSLTLKSGPKTPDPADTEAHAVFVDKQGLWWGCGNSLCQWRNGKVDVLAEAAGLKKLLLQAIFRDPMGNLWVEQNRRLLVLHPGSTRFEEADAHLPPTGMGNPQVDSDGRLLVPTTEGLAIRQDSRFRMAGRTAGLLPPVYSVLQDREGSVWLGLAGRGLAKWLGYREWENFSAQSGLTGETIYEILPVPGGPVWAGTEVGLFRGDRRDGEWLWRPERALGVVPVHAVQAGADGRLWLGTDSRGIARFDPKSGSVKWFGPAEGLSANSPNAILIDHDQPVWAGTEKGVFTSAPGGGKFQRVPEVTPFRCFALLESPAGDIWAATSDGLWQRSRGRWRHFTTADGLRSKLLVSLAADKSGAIWVGYRLSGTVSRLRLTSGKVSISHFDPPRGSAINITYFLGLDARDRLWAGTNLGIQMFTGDGNRWDRYDHHDGLIWDDCDLHGFAAEPDGHIWIGTSGGLSRYMPRSAPAQPAPPRTVFTSVSIGKKEIDPARQLTLNYSSDPLVARFTALRVGRERDLVFRYRLDPLVGTWRETPERELQFPALPAGDYRLEVEARDATSGWGNLPAAFEFRVLAPWWRTWWFLGACSMTASVLAGLLLWRRGVRDDSIRSALENAVAERTRELSHQYRHDVLTGLPNRLLFGERLNGELNRAQRDGSRVAVLFVDLDRFKRVNDTWGHQTGDLFLKQIAQRLRSGLRFDETIARIGGDEFIVLIPRLADKMEAEIRGWDLMRTLDAPIQIERQNVFATMSVGISTFPDDARDASALMAAADAAMYRAKAAGKNQVQLFESGMTEAASLPQDIEDRLREALKRGGFRVHYQPQYTLDGRLEGFEALLRIDGFETELPPGEFIPIAEESGLIVELGAWVLRQACTQVKAWHLSGFPDVRIAVNVSVMQLAHPGFEHQLLSILEETGINPSRLELELTETALVKDTGDSAGLLDRIRKCGIQIALDDFGTGFSPMQYLHQLPVDVVKIDQVFVRDLDAVPSSVPLVEGMVKLAKTLSLRVVAEGVETQAQLEILRHIGFDIAQGNLLSGPVPADQAETLLRAGALVRA